MCGIVGFLDKTENRDAAVGHVLFDMLSALDRRGPDSSGVAIYSDQTDQSSGGDEPPRYVIRVKLGEHGPFESAAQTGLARLTGGATILDSRVACRGGGGGRRGRSVVLDELRRPAPRPRRTVDASVRRKGHAAFPITASIARSS